MLLLLNWMQMMRNMHFWIKFFVVLVGKCFEKGMYVHTTINYKGNITFRFVLLKKKKNC